MSENELPSIWPENENREIVETKFRQITLRDDQNNDTQLKKAAGVIVDQSNTVGLNGGYNSREKIDGLWYKLSFPHKLTQLAIGATKFLWNTYRQHNIIKTGEKPVTKDARDELDVLQKIAEIKKTQADTEKTQAECEGIRLDNEIKKLKISDMYAEQLRQRGVSYESKINTQGGIDYGVIKDGDESTFD